MGIGITNGQGKSLVRFLYLALQDHPRQTVVAVNKMVNPSNVHLLQSGAL